MRLSEGDDHLSDLVNLIGGECFDEDTVATLRRFR
jgi:hypothetical protein